MNDKGFKFVNIIAYCGILFFIPLVLTPQSRIGRFHANHGLVLLLTGVVGNFIIALLPFFGRFTYTLFNLALFALMVSGMYHAWQGIRKPLPLIGKIKIIA